MKVYVVSESAQLALNRHWADVSVYDSKDKARKHINEIANNLVKNGFCDGLYDEKPVKSGRGNVKCVAYIGKDIWWQGVVEERELK